MKSQLIKFGGEEIQLFADRFAYIPAHKCALIADLHWGKTGHFRKNGIGVPNFINQTDFDRLENIVNQTNAESIQILGDCFHSKLNYEIIHLGEFVRKCPIPIKLIPGNHDIWALESLRNIGIEILSEQIQLGKIILTHEPIETDQFQIYGHIHPKVVLKSGLKSLTFPAFIQQKNTLILPAFGTFTGGVQLKKVDAVWACTGSEILSLA